MRKLSAALFVLCCLVSLVFLHPDSTSAQQPAALVIEGGTLIDGNGGAPVRDTAIVIQGNRITAVAAKGKVAYPANARVINAAGKFVLPGLWDSQVAYSWYFGEAMLNHGITASIDVGTDEEPPCPIGTPSCTARSSRRARIPGF